MFFFKSNGKKFGFGFTALHHYINHITISKEIATLFIFQHIDLKSPSFPVKNLYDLFINQIIPIVNRKRWILHTFFFLRILFPAPPPLPPCNFQKHIERLNLRSETLCCYVLTRLEPYISIENPSL